MNDATREKILDDYALSELRRETEGGRLRAANAVNGLVEKLATAERIDDLAKLGPVVAAIVSGGRS